MKNVVIPLDIIFIDEKQTIVKIVEADVEINISDENLTRYLSGVPIKWVVEINQGLSENYGFNIGDFVTIAFP